MQCAKSPFPVRITNANEPLAIIRLGNDRALEVVSKEGLSIARDVR